MNPDYELDQIERYIDYLNKYPQQLNDTAESHFFPVLQRIFFREGFEVKNKVEVNEKQFPFMLVDLDCRRHPVAVDFHFQVNKSASILPSFVHDWADKFHAKQITESLLVLRNVPLHEKHNKILNEFGESVRFLDFNTLKTYASNVFRISKEAKQNRAVIVVVDLIETLITEIAKEAIKLEDIEWFHVEKIFYRLLEGFGFHAHLTPTTKDGGRDILACEFLLDDVHWYSIEIKHWLTSKPGTREVNSFLETSIEEGRKGALFFSTSDVSESATKIRTEVNKDYLRFANKNHLITSCKHYAELSGGVWKPYNTLREFIFSSSY